MNLVLPGLGVIKVFGVKPQKIQLDLASETVKIVHRAGGNALGSNLIDHRGNSPEPVIPPTHSV